MIWFLLENVHCRSPKPSAVQGVGQRCFIYQTTPGRIDDDRARLHPRKCFFIQQMMSVCVVGQVQADNIRFGYQGFKGCQFHAFYSRRHFLYISIVRYHLRFKRTAQPGYT